MKKFLLRSLLFIAPLVLMAYMLDALLTRAMRKAPVGDIKVWDDIFEGRINSDILIYGSSRALNHIDPAILQDSLHAGAYNLGMSGQNFGLVKCRHDVLMKYNKVPKLIIISFDVFLLDKRTELFEYKHFAPFIKEPLIRDATKQLAGFDFYDYYMPLVRYIGYRDEIVDAAKYLAGKPVSAADTYARGFVAHKEGWNGEFDKLYASGKKYVAHIDSATLRIFLAFLDEAKDQHINLLFVYTPEYYLNRNFTENREQVMNLITACSKKYSIPFLDYSDDSMCVDKRYFYNALHLNADGAALFTKRLAYDIGQKQIFR